MKIAFYAQNCLPVHANTLEERPLGGTETGLIRLAEVLQGRGHEVVVFTSLKDPPASRPAYLHFEQAHRLQPFDLFVAVKDWRSIFYGVRANRYLYWTGDGYDQYINYGLGDARVERKLHSLLLVSEWHRETLCQASGFNPAKTAVIGNGVHLPYYSGSEERNRHRLIFTAAPYRGLQLMPQIFQMLKQKHPALELHVFAGLSVYDTDRPFQGPHVQQYEELAQILRKIPGVTLHGNVMQRVLARELMKSAVFVYPNSVNETCCMTAIEAQAAGCPIVASANSALPETVGEAGFLIDKAVGTPEYLREFAMAVDRLLSDDSTWRAQSGQGIARSHSRFRWELVADRFESAALEKRSIGK